MTASISTHEIRAEVERFWNILSGKSPGKLEDLYSPLAVVFTGKAKRSEPGQLTAMRRMRKFVGATSASNAEIDPIEVQFVGTDVAIASYTYRFYSSNTHRDGSRVKRTAQFGRSTQIFQRDDRGALKIVHEHLSSAAAPEVEKVQG
jgi:ketosteroid isomerase-like protein